jgi:hypothetical protein
VTDIERIVHVGVADPTMRDSVGVLPASAGLLGRTDAFSGEMFFEPGRRYRTAGVLSHIAAVRMRRRCECSKWPRITMLAAAAKKHQTEANASQ